MKVWLVTSSCMCDDSCGCGSDVEVSSTEVLTKFPYGL